MPDTVSPPLFSALIAGSLLTLQTVLMLTVGMYRTSASSGVGHEGDPALERLVRRHANLAENAAIFLVVLALYELLFGTTKFVMIIGLVFATARVMHVVGFSSDAGSHLVNPTGGRRVFVLLRAGGAGLTALSTLALGLTLVVTLVRAL
ncbi:MAG: MAPEG family protein [Pseudomonadota bacterium]